MVALLGGGGVRRLTGGALIQAGGEDVGGGETERVCVWRFNPCIGPRMAVASIPFQEE